MKLTSEQLKRIIAEEVNRVLSEASNNRCRLVAVYDDEDTFEFSVGDVKNMSCKVGDSIGGTIANIRECAKGYGVTDIDPGSCEKVARMVHATDDLGETESFEDPRRRDFYLRGSRALLSTIER